MQKFISISYKTTLKKLHIAEHFFFYDSAIISILIALINAIPQVSGMFDALKTAFEREDALYKRSQASILTAKLTNLNGKRCAYFSHLWCLVDIFKYENLAANIQEAVEILEFLHNTYKMLIYGNYYEVSGMMINFLQDCEKPEYKPYIELLGLMPIVDKMKAAEVEFEALYHERSFNKEQIADMGKLTEIRVEVDNAFTVFVDAINFAWTANEMGAKDTTLSTKLLEVKEHIYAGIHEAELTLARRGHHKPKDDDRKDDETQTPDATNPPAPTTPPQNPDTTLPPAPDTPDQNPVAVPPGINPEDLNPPEAGE